MGSKIGSVLGGCRPGTRQQVRASARRPWALDFIGDNRDRWRTFGKSLECTKRPLEDVSFTLSWPLEDGSAGPESLQSGQTIDFGVSASNHETAESKT